MASGVVAALIIILTVTNMHGTASADVKLIPVDDRRHQAFSGLASISNTSAPPSANNTSASSANANTSAPTANTTAEPTSGQSFVSQGTASSQSDPLPGHEKEYVAAILKLRSDNGVYSGVLTYAASKGANVEIWHAFSVNTTKIPKSFGVLKTASYNGMPIALTDISPSGSSGSVPFSGNAVVLHATSPFTVTYTVNAVAQPSKTVNNMQSAMAVFNSTSSSTTLIVHHKHHGHTSGGY